MLEEERKFEVDPPFRLPSLDRCVPRGGQILPRSPKSLRATYYDTADLRLARAGISLRHRRGDEEPWTVKLPTAVPGVRQEISRSGPPGAVPDEFRRLLTAYHRGAELAPVVTMRTVRRRYELQDSDGRMLVEIADDTVDVVDGPRADTTFREIEAERYAGDGDLLDKVSQVLRDAGATEGEFVPKHVRAMGPAAAEPPDLVPPADKLLPNASAAAVVTRALRRDIGQIFEYDPLVRRREVFPDGDTAVHQMRVGTRRLRSDLRTFRPLLNGPWADALRAELSWLAEALGHARDAEVLRARLRRTATADPLAPLDGGAVARIDADLAARHAAALDALDAVLASDRYVDLCDHLIAAARAPEVAPGARRSAAEVLPRLVGRPWRRLRDAAGLSPDDSDHVWHAVRILGKRARYAADAVAGALGGGGGSGGAGGSGGGVGGAGGLAKALGKVQNVLGEHQDAAVAAETWLAASAAEPDDHVLAVTSGRLYERERAAIREARRRFPDVWKAADRAALTDWLDS